MTIVVMLIMIVTIVKIKLIRIERNEREVKKSNWIKEINATVNQPTLRPVEDKEKIKKLKEFLAKHRTERVGK